MLQCERFASHCDGRGLHGFGTAIHPLVGLDLGAKKKALMVSQHLMGKKGASSKSFKLFQLMRVLLSCHLQRMLVRRATGII